MASQGMISVRFSGIENVHRRLSALGGAAQAKTLKGVIRKASAPIVVEAKRRAPSPVIAGGIRVVNVIVDGRSQVTAEVGLPGGRRPWFHGLFVEKGTGPRRQKSTGRYTGSMPANPFLRPAFDTKKEEVQEVFAAELRVALNRALGFDFG